MVAVLDARRGHLRSVGLSLLDEKQQAATFHVHDGFVSLGISPLGLVVAGEAANYGGVRSYFVVASLICALPGFYIHFSRHMNKIDALRRATATETVS